MAAEFRAVVVSEGEVERCFEFDTEQEMISFAAGAGYGASLYAGDGLAVFYEGEMPDEEWDGPELVAAVKKALTDGPEKEDEDDEE